ncbi:ribosomal protein S18 acetylase RimI-like enzyme [Kribbella voronezhensis]|uniref:Ribosomal protein S18 acetylase RimI-like enzyme n=1 Tax=Kribbella voronezhensis TaxID=2512212 RepID=A0A4R7TI21_9ACTN|nr:GNAT family N-acetyltransferase [Kribbella voronezhensis]TDU91147.1 ribosomal protein S18 acetylase RimI-like enzyme [Kribbella voronezhensis]
MTEAAKVTVRQAVEEDSAALIELERTAFDSRSGFPSFRTAVRESFFTERCQPEHVLVAVDGDEIIGFARLTDKYPFVEGAGVLMVGGLAVAPTARRRGVGSALLEAVEAEGRRRGARKISLNVFGVNTEAQRLYAKHGYVVEARQTAEFTIDGELMNDLGLALFL